MFNIILQHILTFSSSKWTFSLEVTIVVPVTHIIRSFVPISKPQQYVYSSSLAFCTELAASFCDRVLLKTELWSYINKGMQHPDFLRQLALETIRGINVKTKMK
ncbi:hypothetical protein CDAR_452241 [Caerostris darwini]|uniref:Uncharacterized protein n=1 Tax=Caerostris darwini TaxID=1538125 RepID=A0AAV4PNP9_9ARAC|nr:hypothetical protein CDAR_452241 [Caerostris darwini]